MRILRICDVADNRTSGMSRTMYSTGDVLRARGHDVEYLFHPHLQPHWKGPRRFSVPLLLPALVRASQRAGRRYDVVEIHEPLAAAYCRERRTRADLPPVVVFSYGLEERGRQAELTYRRQKGLPISLKRRVSPLSVTLQAAYAVRHADHVICSNATDVEYLAQVGVSRERLTQHHSGADPEFLDAGKRRQESENRATSGDGQTGSGASDDAERANILFLGGWLLRKGVLDVVPAVSRALAENPCLRFTAAGFETDADAVRAHFAPSLRDRVQAIPNIAGNAALIDVYARHAVFLLPSFFEGQPLVMMEAATLGMAIVSTNIGGVKDFIQNGVNGLLAEVGDTTALTEQLCRIVRDRELARRLGENARRAVQEYTWESAARKVEQAYAQAIAAGPRS